MTETGLLWLRIALDQMDAKRASGAVWLYEEQSQEAGDSTTLWTVKGERFGRSSLP